MIVMWIYIVEDDENIRQMESYALKSAGFDTLELGDGSALFTACAERIPELVVLDIMLPGESGYAILSRMRASGTLRRVPVVMVTACASEIEAVRGLDAGSDDYITKPFGVMEFISRIRAVLRRTQSVQPATLTVGAITLDDECHTVTSDGLPRMLTLKEYDLLKCLMLNAGAVLTRDRLMDKVWSTDYAGESRTVDMHVKSLRQKLGTPGMQIKTVRSVGYKIEAD